MKANALCEYLDWDSEFFGRRIARVTANRLTTETMASVLGWCEEKSIECLYFLADASDRTSALLAGDNRFHLVDVRVAYERALDGEKDLGEKAPEVRPPVAEDIPALRAIASASHSGSRFYFDPGFSTSACDALYATWIER